MPASLAALLCVCGIAAGQLLFKCTADSQSMSGSYLHPALSFGYFQPFGSMESPPSAGFGPCSRASFASLSLDGTRIRDCSAAEFSTAGEKLQMNYWLKVAMIVAGVSIAVRS